MGSVVQLPKRAAAPVTQHDIAEYRLFAYEFSEARAKLREKRKFIVDKLLAGDGVEKGPRTATLPFTKRGEKTIQRLKIGWDVR